MHLPLCLSPLTVLACTAAALCACESPKCPELPAPRPVSNQPYGGACSADADCAEGLLCLATNGAQSSWKMCSRPCDPCPTDTAYCLTIGAEYTGTVEQKVCIPSCQTDEDCLKGEHVMRCGKSDGNAYGTCMFIQCSSHGDECPGGSTCVGELCFQYEDGYGLNSGYCQKVP